MKRKGISISKGIKLVNSHVSNISWFNLVLVLTSYVFILPDLSNTMTTFCPRRCCTTLNMGAVFCAGVPAVVSISDRMERRSLKYRKKGCLGLSIFRHLAMFSSKITKVVNIRNILHFQKNNLWSLDEAASLPRHFFLGRVYCAESLPPHYVVHHYRHDRKTPTPK